MSDNESPETELDPKQKFNLETGKLSWPELQTYFARGVVIVASPGLDLIDIAVQLKDDNAQQIEQLIEQNKIVRANDEHAIQWLKGNPTFWAVVVSPWVLVQEIIN